MRFIVSSSALYNRLQTVGRVIASNNAYPIMKCFLFEIHENILSITASDSENTLITAMELVESEGDVRFCIEAKNIQDFLKEIAEQPLSFEVDPGTMGIKGEYQNGCFNIVGQSADNYPKLDIPQDGMTSIVLPAKTMLNGISRCLFATSDDEMRLVMNGVFFDIQEDSMTFASTDGHKLVRDRSYAVKGNQPSSFILPKKPATILKSLLPDEADDVTLRFNKQNAYVTMGASRLICRLVEGRYPNYNSVIPQNNPFRVTADRLSLMGALRRASIFTNPGNALIKLHLDRNMMTVSGQDTDFSTSAEERMPCDYEGSPISIGFKGPFLIDILNNIGGENVVIELADASRPGVIMPTVQDEDENLLMLLMPMMLND